MLRPTAGALFEPDYLCHVNRSPVCQVFVSLRVQPHKRRDGNAVQHNRQGNRNQDNGDQRNRMRRLEPVLNCVHEIVQRPNAADAEPASSIRDIRAFI